MSVTPTPVDPLPLTPVATTTPAAAVAIPIDQSAQPGHDVRTAGTAAAPRRSPGPSRSSLKKDTVIGIRIDQAISSETAHADDKISAKVSRDVIVDGTTAIPAGMRLEGTVVTVERPTASNPRGKLDIQFTSLVRADNSRVAIVTETISREARDPNAAGTGSFDVNAFSAVVGGNSRAAAAVPHRFAVSNAKRTSRHSVARRITTDRSSHDGAVRSQSTAILNNSVQPPSASRSSSTSPCNGNTRGRGRHRVRQSR